MNKVTTGSLDLSVSDPILKVLAEKCVEKFGYCGFICLNEWLDRFKNRHWIIFEKMWDEAKSSNMADIMSR